MSNVYSTIKTYINKAKEVHGDNYEYSNIISVGAKVYIPITCLKHGEFNQRCDVHLSSIIPCSKCRGETVGDNLIKICGELHGYKYDYSKVNYINTETKVSIICPTHGVFKKTFKKHKMGQGCPKCVDKNPYKGRELEYTNELINVGNEINSYKYDYSKVVYRSAKRKVIIICPTHGEFKQTPNKHKIGRGCPHCNESNGEKLIRNFLIKRNIKYIPQYKFDDCINIRPLPFDFYLPEHNICIEYQGIQHYEIVEHFGGEVKFIEQQLNDKIKMEYCQKNNIPLIIIKYDESITDHLHSLISLHNP